MQHEAQNKQKFKRFLKQTMRVLRIIRRPDRKEYGTLLKVTGLGIAIIGIIGFVIFLVKQLIL